MEIKNWYVIGIMSGTSLDGVDLAYVKISRNSGYDFELLQTESLEYSELWKNTNWNFHLIPRVAYYISEFRQLAD